MTVKASVSGGGGMEAALKKIGEKLAKASKVNVGFLEGATYPDGTPVAYVASVNEFGGTAKIPAHTQTIYRKVKKNGDFAKNGRFVKASQSNFASDHEVEAHTITIPARPFFRTMVKAGGQHWGKDLGEVLKDQKYDAEKSFALMGKQIEGELTQSIRDWSDPPNAASTVAKKGFDKPLIASGDMVRAVDSEVE